MGEGTKFYVLDMLKRKRRNNFFLSSMWLKESLMNYLITLMNFPAGYGGNLLGENFVEQFISH